jgi:hypothetical protein
MEIFSGHSQASTAVISLNRWLAQVGVTQITAWRWRRRGWLKTVMGSGLGESPAYRER